MLLPSGFVGATASSYQIARSLRFNNADNARLTRTPGSAGNQKQWTWSGWIKRGNLTGVYSLFGMYGASYDTNRFDCAFMSNTGTNADTLTLCGHSTAWRTTTRVFRDPTAWFHLVVSWDTSLGNNAIKIWINGVEETSFSTSNAVTANTDYGMCGTGQHFIGCHWHAGSSATIQWFDGLMAEIHFIDGSVLTPTTFGETDAITGMWKAKQPVGLTYGTTGYWLSFADNASTTTLGEDDAGGLAGAGAGSNDWTLTNFSVTAGVGNDSLTDTPTNYGTDTGAGGEVRGNYCTLNSINAKSTTLLTNGNLRLAGPGSGAQYAALGTFGMKGGKWYWEYHVTVGGNEVFPGFCDAAISRTQINDGVFTGSDYEAYGYQDTNGNKRSNGGTTSVAYGNSFTTNDVIGCALDLDNGKAWWSKNGTWQASGDPAAGTSAAFTGLDTAKSWVVWGSVNGNATPNLEFNFGQRAFAYTAPSGFKALCTQNMATPAIAKPKQYFDTAIYAGNATNPKAVVSDGSVANDALLFKPSLVWIKNRTDAATGHAIFDAVRGVQKFFTSDAITDEDTDDTQSLLSFDTVGFSLGTGASTANVNTSAKNYVSWLWKANDAGVAGTGTGNIASVVQSVDTTSGLSIISYTGSSTSASGTITHGLGVAPKFLIVKARTTTSTDTAPVVWHTSLTTPTTDYLILNTTAALASAATMWNSTIPTTTTISLGTDVRVNTVTNTYVAYAFAEVDGFSKFGKYTGNAAADGPFVWCGFRPRWFMVKCASATNNWVIFDAARSTYNATNEELYADVADAGGSNNRGPDFLSNGVKIRATTSFQNSSGATYVFAAFAEHPFKYARAR